MLYAEIPLWQDTSTSNSLQVQNLILVPISSEDMDALT